MYAPSTTAQPSSTLLREMTRFSTADRERIRAQLIEAGRELFAQFGFERTRIKDVTEAVGIGTSTFYQFFDSKEELYVSVLRVEREQLLEDLDAATATAGTPREEVRTLLTTLLSAVRSNPLISRLIIENELRDLKERLSPEQREAIRQNGYDTDLPYADGWVTHDSFRLDDPDIVSGMIRALVFVTRAKEESFAEADGFGAYEDVEAALIETVVNGLFAERDDRDGDTKRTDEEGATS